MKKTKLFDLLQGLREVSSHPGAKFAYGVAKNISVITTECELLQKLITPAPEFQAFNQERVKLAERLATKNDDGSPMDDGKEYIFTAEARKTFETELAKLRSQHADAIAVQEQKTADFNLLLEEESDITLFKIKSDLLPEAITAAQVSAIIDIIED